MSEAGFHSLGEVIDDPLFPRLDQALRNGEHVDDQAPADYHFLLDAQRWLEPFYLRYGADLVHAPDGFFYLRPVGDRLPVRRLRPAEMIVGQTLALFSLEPATLELGYVTNAQLLERLRDLLGDRLPQALKPKLSARAAQHRAQREARSAVRGALKRLAALGFVDLDDIKVILRPPLMRFVDAARGGEDLAESLDRLIRMDEVELLEPTRAAEADADDDETEDGE